MSFHGTAYDELGSHGKHSRDLNKDFSAASQAPSLGHLSSHRGPANQNVEGFFGIRLRPRGGRMFQLACKRAIDVAVSSLALLVLSPLFLVLAVLVMSDTPGPAFFVQERWGRRGRKIRVLKFRTMHAERSDAAGIIQAAPNDPRVTRLGRLLRRTNLDELPQLWNVLRGDMSLIGPRCHAIGMLGGGVPYEELVPEYHQRHDMRPGITGLAQASGYRGPTVDAEKARGRIELDLIYVRRFSLWLDLKIAIRTIASEWRGGTGL
jgi:lipopolysaccharide/colanic/teichoic acid biosynthesis glycosyltransferase